MRTSTLVFSVTAIACAALGIGYRQQLTGAREQDLERHTRVATPAPHADSPRIVREWRVESPSPAAPEAPMTRDVEPPRAHEESPAFLAALRNRQRQSIELGFRDLPKLLGLSPERASEVFDLMTEQGMELFELQRRQPGDEVQARELDREYEVRRREHHEQMARLIGDTNMVHLQAFRDSLTSRKEVNQLRIELADSQDPLRDDQIEPLVAVVHVEMKRLEQELRDLDSARNAASPGAAPIDTMRMELAMAAHGRILDSVRPLLSTAQHAAWQGLYHRQRLQWLAEAESARLQNEAQAQVQPPGK